MEKTKQDRTPEISTNCKRSVEVYELFPEWAGEK